MNIKPVFRFRFRDSLRGTAIFFGILLLVTFSIVLQAEFVNWGDFTGSINFSGYEIAACITLFVSGICTVREDLRLGIQNGISRRTVFFATLLSSILIALTLAVAGELLTTAAQAVARRYENISVFSLYQFICGYEYESVNIPLPVHIASILFMLEIFVCANLVGSIISLVFFRLNKTWTIIVAVGTPLLLGWVLPLVLSLLGIAALPCINIIFATTSRIFCFFALCAIAAATLNRLLTLRVPIKAAIK